MIHALASLNLLVVLLLSVLGFAFGALWYSPWLFAKAWTEEMKLTPDKMDAQRKRTVVVMPSAFLCTVLSTFAVATVVAANHSAGALKGAELGLLVGAGLVASRQATSALFEGRTLRHFLIVSGHDVALFVLQGAFLGVWR